MTKGMLRLLCLWLFTLSVCHASEEEGDHRDYIKHRKLSFGTGNRILKQYVVQFRDDEDDVAGVLSRLFRDGDGDVLPNVIQTYNRVFRGALIGKLGLRFLRLLLADDAVIHIEEDVEIEAQTTDQMDAPWGLDRIDQETLPLDGIYRFTQTGSSVLAFVFDSGIDATHPEFEGRASCGINTLLLGNCDDNSGHGTAVASTLGGVTFGVAKEINIEAVKVLNRFGTGFASNMLQGFEYVAERREEQPDTPMIVNLSVHSIGRQSSTELAIQSLTAMGVTVVGAAGNQDADACGFSPASMSEVITVGATDRNDTRADSSNFGACVDIFAPGVDVAAAVAGADVVGGPGGTFSGTSMAVPYVAGVAALYLQDDPMADPAAVKAFLERQASVDVVSDPGPLSPNLLVNSFATAPSDVPSTIPTFAPSVVSSTSPSSSAVPTWSPIAVESGVPSSGPSLSSVPSITASDAPSDMPSTPPSSISSGMPSVAPAETLVVQINTGNVTDNYIAVDGSTWVPDIYNTIPGVYTENYRTYTGTDDDFLYGTDHATVDGSSLVYEIPLIFAGTHRIDLHFAEMENPRIGQRIMDIFVNDMLVLDDFDIREVAPRNAALVVPVFYEVAVSEETLKLEFLAVASLPAKINAIGVYQIEEASAMPSMAPTSSAMPTIGPRDWSSEFRPPTGNLLSHDRLDKLGASVAISGEYLAIGAPKDGSDTAGRVYAYKKDEDFDDPTSSDFNKWNGRGRLTHSPQRSGDFFGQNVALHGETLVVSSRTSTVGSGNSAAFGYESSVAVYKLNRLVERFVLAQTFEQSAIDSTDKFDYFGSAISIYGNTIAIGSMKQDAVIELGMEGDAIASQMGAVHIYTRADENAAFVNTTVIYADDVDTMQDFAKFGRSIKLFGNKMVVGSEDSEFESSAGAVYVFERVDELSPYVQTGKLVMGVKQDYFGWSVDVNDEFILAGAIGAHKAFLFSSTAPYPLITTFAPSGVGQGYPSKFGSSVALGDGLIVVGAPRGDGIVTDSGTVHVFRVSPETAEWEEEITLTASNGARMDRFGYAVAAEGTNVVVGAPHNDDFGSFAGLVYSYLPKE